MQIPEPTIREAVAAVFSDPAYGSESLLSRIRGWILDLIESLLLRLDPGGMPPWAFWALVGLTAALLLALLGRAAWAARALRRARTAGAAALAGPGEDADPWAAAASRAAAGNFDAAVHALYAAVLHALAGGGYVELHESKTVGDYLRELAARSVPWRGVFQEFARGYELVAYGGVRCDADRYGRLLGLAGRLAGRGG